MISNGMAQFEITDNAKLSASGGISQYAAPNERGDNLHSHFWDKISYTCSFQRKK
jgi:hypothetical protein